MTSPGAGGGGANLGTAYGKVRVDYESSGVGKAVKDVEALQSTMVRADAAMASSSKTTATTAAQVNNFASQMQKASDVVNKYASDLANAQKKAESLAKTGVKGQPLIDSKSAVGQLSSDLAKAKRELAEFQKTVAATPPGKLPTPKADPAGVRGAVRELMQGIRNGIDQELPNSGGGGILDRMLNGRGGRGGAADAGQRAGREAGNGLSVGMIAGFVAKSSAVAAAIGSVGYVLTKGFTRLTSLDEAATKLKALGFSAEKIKAVSQSALESVKGTAFGLDEAFNTAAQAIAAGIKPGQELTDYLKVIADNAALAGTSMQEMGYIFGQVATNGKLTGEDMAQFLDRNIDIIGRLADTMQKPRSAIRQLVSDGKVDFATFQKAMGANAGAAVTMGNSITGSFTNMKAAISRVGAALLAPLFGSATGEAGTFAKAIQWVTAQIGKLEAWLGSHKSEMIDWWGSAAKGAISFAESVTHAVGSVLKIIGQLTSALSEVVGYMAGFDETLSNIPGFGDNNKEAKQLRQVQQGLKGFSGQLDKWGQSAENSTGIWTDAKNAVDGWVKSSKAALNTTASLGDTSADAAVKTQTLEAALEGMQFKADNVTKSLEGTNEQFQEFLKQLKDKGAAQDIIDTVTKLRSQFENGGRQAKVFADAVRDFGDKSLSASDRADKLLTSLQGLGLLPGADNLREYNKQLEEMTKYDNHLIDLTDTMGSALINFDGTLNSSLKNGATLEDQISNIRKSMVQLVASGEATPDEAFNRTAEGLRILLSDAGISGADAEKVINKYLPSPKALAEAMKNNVGGALGAAGMDPMKVDTELKLITQANDILKNIVGPDGLLHVPTVLDTTAPGTPGAPGAPAGPGGSIVGGAKGALTPQHGKLPSAGAAQRYQKPPDSEAWKAQLGLLGDNFRWPTGNGQSALNPQQSLNAVEQEALADPARVEAAWNQMDEITQIKLRAIKDQAEQQGKNLAQAYAEGVFSGEEYLRDAIKRLAGVAADGLGHSPAKYGPLAGKGWSYFRGQTFTKDWASGIQSESKAAQLAVEGTAGSAVVPFGDKVEQMVKDFQQFSDLGKHVLDFVNQVSSIGFGIATLANDLSGGKLFPKSYVKDTSAKSPTGSRLNPWMPAGGSYAGAGGPGATGLPSLAGVDLTGGKSVLHDAEGVASQTASKTTAGIISQLFPEIQSIGGGRASGTKPNTHDVGRAIDVMIPGYDTPQGKALGDKINEFVRAYHDVLGVDYTIWQNTWKDFQGNISTVAGHMNHIDIQFKKDFIPNLQGLSDVIGNVPGVSGAPGAAGQPPSASATQGGGSATPVTGMQLKDIGGGYYKDAKTGAVLREVGGQYYDASKLQVGANGAPELGPDGKPKSLVPQGAKPAPTGLTGNSQQDIANYIYGQAIAAGYNDQEARAFVVQGFGESGLKAGAFGASTGDASGGASGIFQFTPGTWSSFGAGGNPLDAKSNIDAYFRLAKARDPGSGDIKSRLAKISGGGPAHPANVGHWDTALSGAAPFLSGIQPSNGMPVDITNPELSQIANNTGAFPQALDQLGLPSTLSALAGQDKMLSDAVAASRGQLQLTDEQVVPALQHLDGLIADSNNLKTPQGKAQADALGSIRSSLMSQSGMTEGQTGLQAAQAIASGVQGVASAVFDTIDSSLKAVSATKNIGDTLVRGIGSTEDIYNIIENIQSYIDLGSKIANLVSQTTGLASQIVGAAGAGDSSGASSGIAMALGAVSSVASIVSQVYAAINTGIDIGQEIYRIGSKYFGRFLTSWFGFPGASDLQYLLDKATGQLQVYTSENPQLKHSFNTLDRQLGMGNYPGRAAPNNTWYIYQGPGQDYRDTMNDQMFAIKSSGVGAFGYAD